MFRVRLVYVRARPGGKQYKEKPYMCSRTFPVSRSDDAGLLRSQGHPSKTSAEHSYWEWVSVLEFLLLLLSLLLLCRSGVFVPPLRCRRPEAVPPSLQAALCLSDSDPCLS